MRIGDYNRGMSAAAGQAPQRSSEGAAASRSASNDAVELTRLSNLAAQSAPGEGRLEELRRQVSAGDYSVPAGELTKKIVEFL